MSKIWFTSDTHFFHKLMVEKQLRPFESIYTMNECLVNTWNQRVSEDDIVYHLGDVSFGKTEWTMGLLAGLKGEKHLILGNHDKKMIRFSRFFESIHKYHEIYVGKQKICLFHYPIVSWNKSHRGSWNLHGHCHFSLKPDPNARRLDVGVDNPLCKWGPIDVEQVGAYMDTINFEPVDHHA